MFCLSFQCFAFAITFLLGVKFFYIVGLFFVKHASLLTEVVCLFLLEQPSGHFCSCDFSWTFWTKSIWRSEECQECWVLCSALNFLGWKARALRSMCPLSVLKVIEWTGQEEFLMTDDSSSWSIWLWRGILQMVGGNELSGCKPRVHQGGWWMLCGSVSSVLAKKSSAPLYLHSVLSSWVRNTLLCVNMCIYVWVFPPFFLFNCLGNLMYGTVF